MMGNGTWVPFTAASSEMNGTGLAPGGSAAAPAPADVVMSEPSTSQPAGAATTAESMPADHDSAGLHEATVLHLLFAAGQFGEHL